MAAFNFYLRDKNANKETPIVLFVYYNHQRFKIPTGKKIHPKCWNENKQRARSSATSTSPVEFNAALNSMIAAAKNLPLKLGNELGRPPSSHELKEAIKKAFMPEAEGKVKEIEKPSFFEAFARFIKESETGERLTVNGTRYSQRLIKKYKTTETRLKEFTKKYHLEFENIDQAFHKKFTQFLTSKGYRPNTVGKYFAVVKTFMNYATENGYNSNTHFRQKSFKVINQTGYSIYLTKAEINDLWELDLSKESRLEAVRDLFLVGCHTGLRYGDLARLNKSHVDDGFIRIKTQKTENKVIIPVHEIVEKIMLRYDGFPKAISNQKTNKYLKEITALVPSLQKIEEVEQVEGGRKVARYIPKWQLVTTHTARRSFATNLYKDGEMTAVDIMKITGHRTEEAFFRYIKVTNEEAANKLKSTWENERKQKVDATNNIIL